MQTKILAHALFPLLLSCLGTNIEACAQASFWYAGQTYVSTLSVTDTVTTPDTKKYFKPCLAMYCVFLIAIDHTTRIPVSHSCYNCILHNLSHTPFVVMAMADIFINAF